MRPAALAVSSVLVAFAAAVACGGGVNLVDPLNGREKPVSGEDSPPSSTDPPPSGYQAPPAGNEAPPTEGDPANQAGANVCIECSGNYECTVPNVTGSAILGLELKNGKCDVSVSGDNVSVPYVPACGVDIPSSVMAGGVDVTVSRAGGGGFKACVVIDASAPICITCSPTDQTVPPGSGSGTASSTGVTIGEPGTSATDNGGGCTALSSCCSQLPSLDQPSCTGTVKEGNSLACSDALTGFEEANLCH